MELSSFLICILIFIYQEHRTIVASVCSVSLQQKEKSSLGRARILLLLSVLIMKVSTILTFSRFCSLARWDNQEYEKSLNIGWTDVGRRGHIWGPLTFFIFRYPIINWYKQWCGCAQEGTGAEHSSKGLCREQSRGEGAAPPAQHGPAGAGAPGSCSCRARCQLPSAELPWDAPAGWAGGSATGSAGTLPGHQKLVQSDRYCPAAALQTGWGCDSCCCPGKFGIAVRNEPSLAIEMFFCLF